MKVYIVLHWSIESGSVDGVFSTRERALAWARRELGEINSMPQGWSQKWIETEDGAVIVWRYDANEEYEDPEDAGEGRCVQEFIIDETR